MHRCLKGSGLISTKFEGTLGKAIYDVIDRLLYYTIPVEKVNRDKSSFRCFITQRNFNTHTNTMMPCETCALL